MKGQEVSVGHDETQAKWSELLARGVVGWMPWMRYRLTPKGGAYRVRSTSGN